jgi:hypothetical protein
VTYSVAYGLPELRKARQRKAENRRPTDRPDVGWILLTVALALGTILLGGVAAWLLGDSTTTAKHAFIYGVGGEATVATLARAAVS